MIEGQISIFEFMKTESVDCSTCNHFFMNNCRLEKCKYSKRISKWESQEPTYQRWLKTPKETFIMSSQQERKELMKFVGVLTKTEYGRAHHVCKEMPSNIHAWLNSCNENYFVFSEKSASSGEQFDICPYCGSNLKKNEGGIILFKKHEKYFIEHVFYDKPIHEKGFMTEDEKNLYSEIFKKHFRR